MAALGMWRMKVHVLDTRTEEVSGLDNANRLV
jgi:hypothetical protein